MLEIIFLRRRLVWRTRRAERLHNIWLPLLVESLEQIPEHLPPLSRSDMLEFLLLWNHLQESLRDQGGENLIVVARLLKIDREALKLLGHRNLREKLLASQTLGSLRERSAWEDLRWMTESDDPVLSLSAARALMRIDTRRALPLILPIIARRDDWAYAVVGTILKEAGADVISEPLARAALLNTPEQAPRILRFLELAHPHTVVPAVRRIITNASDLETITACLRILQDPEDLPLVRAFLKDERWEIRLHAAVCLGRIGTPEDEARLIEATRDPHWWVRYRAAQALANLPFILPEQLEKIAETHPDKSARDIIRQVITEGKVTK